MRVGRDAMCGDGPFANAADRLILLDIERLLDAIVIDDDFERLVAAAVMLIIGAAALDRDVAGFLLFQIARHRDSPYLPTLDAARNRTNVRQESGFGQSIIGLEATVNAVLDCKGGFMMALSLDAHEGVGKSTIPASLEAFLGIADLWKLSTEEQLKLLGSPGRSTFFKWKKEGGALPEDIDERISHVLGIYKCLQILMPVTDRADDWIRRPNEYFDDQSALEVMLGGKVVHVYTVRQYLDAQRGG